MLWILAVARAADLAWQCPAIEDLDPFRDVGVLGTDAVWEEVEAVLLGALDDGCPGIELPSEDDHIQSLPESWTGACTTEAGRVVSGSVEQWESSWADGSIVYWCQYHVSTGGSYDLTVTAPSGSSWTELHVHASTSVTSAYGWSPGGVSWSASWVGSLGSTLPLDGTLAASNLRSGNTCSDVDYAERTESWDDGACAWEAEDCGGVLTVTVDGTTVEDAYAQPDGCDDDEWGLDCDDDAQVRCGTDGDCDDHDATVNMYTEEVLADGIDQDCSGFDAVDADGDGYLAEDECDDANASAHPGGIEIPYDGIDQDCSWGDETDVDDDRRRAASTGGDDCDDTNPEIPGIDASCDGVDQDCDGADTCVDVPPPSGRCGGGASAALWISLAASLGAIRRPSAPPV